VALPLALSHVSARVRGRSRLWPVSKAGNRPRESRPSDTIPTKQELLGLMLVAERGWGDPVSPASAWMGSPPLLVSCTARSRHDAVNDSADKIAEISEVAMLWAIDRPRRHRALRAREHN
jgi:hypothetical protein